ncbi:hypothetical protein B296_00045067 [Ensete ventricosum]|uniref:Uncharacterized protein n=1 Tax=Ensete ventricosum TaxID=4639 RepID=A0A426XU16_ENSVE|nr:hypothetical protein B296_00045067 [Ensete ventricosum]
MQLNHLYPDVRAVESPKSIGFSLHAKKISNGRWCASNKRTWEWTRTIDVCLLFCALGILLRPPLHRSLILPVACSPFPSPPSACRRPLLPVATNCRPHAIVFLLSSQRPSAAFCSQPCRLYHAALPHLPYRSPHYCHCYLLSCHYHCPASFFLPYPTSTAVAAPTTITLCSCAQPITVALSSSPPHRLPPLPTISPMLLSSPSPLPLLLSPPHYHCFPPMTLHYALACLTAALLPYCD